MRLKAWNVFLAEEKLSERYREHDDHHGSLAELLTD